MEAEGRRKAEAPLTSKQAAAATAGIEGAIFEDCVCVGVGGGRREERRMRGWWWCCMPSAKSSCCRAVAPLHADAGSRERT